MLCWGWFVAGHSDIFGGLCTHQGGQYCDYGLMLRCSPVIFKDARQEIGDAPLTLISSMGQRACHLPFYIYSRPITHLWIDVTMQPIDCRNDQTEIVRALLMLTLEIYLQALGAQSFCLKFIMSFLTANIQFQGIIICVEKHRGLSVSEQQRFTSSVQYMM